MRPAAATATATASASIAKDDALLRFPMKAYAPRAAPLMPRPEPALPQSIKDAIVRWLDEQM